ncbi:hypothetical protein QQF64_019962 [Cirrhinus molitorella]|uniref:Uncharacterized protein n=1 Tax=Cirrhinus molitorella TaxID=172907 RepID=A0ABR3LJC6_9TELE
MGRGEKGEKGAQGVMWPLMGPGEPNRFAPPPPPRVRTPPPPQKKFLIESTRFTWVTCFGFKTANFAERSDTITFTVQSPYHLPVSLIVLISAVAGSLLIIATVGILCICRKHRKTDQEVQANEEEITYAETTFHERKAQKSNVKEEEDVVYAGVVTRR